jgi:hypothetical protein
MFVDCCYGTSTIHIYPYLRSNLPFLALLIGQDRVGVCVGAHSGAQTARARAIAAGGRFGFRGTSSGNALTAANTQSVKRTPNRPSAPSSTSFVSEKKTPTKPAIPTQGSRASTGTMRPLDTRSSIGMEGKATSRGSSNGMSNDHMTMNGTRHEGSTLSSDDQREGEHEPGTPATNQVRHADADHFDEQWKKDLAAANAAKLKAGRFDYKVFIHY